MAVASQSVDHCRRGNAGYVHGGARYQYRQRGAAAHRRQSFSGHRREYVGADVLSRFERHRAAAERLARWRSDRKSTRLNSSHTVISYAVFCLKKKKKKKKEVQIQR